MMLRGIVVLGSLCMVGLAHGQELPLWRLENAMPARMVPAYGGSMSPFALSSPSPVSTGPAEAADAERIAGQQREMALKQAIRLSNPDKALQARMMAPAKAMTNGPKGQRVLVGGDWVGVGDKITVRYVVLDATREALRELQKFDAEEAYRLAGKLEKRQREIAGRPNVVTVIDPKAQIIRVKGDLGELVLPLQVESAR